MRVCVFCGSNLGARPGYLAAAEALGREIAGRGAGLVYGGSKVGLMGAVANAALQAGGEVIGVIPQALVDKEIAHPGLSALHIVGSMHERKAMMADLSGGFVALPGGIGTLEELFEIWTWGQLGYHAKPVGVLNVEGFYDAMLTFLDHVSSEGYVRRDHRDMLVVEEDPARLIDRFGNYVPPNSPKWIGPTER